MNEENCACRQPVRKGRSLSGQRAACSTQQNQRQKYSTTTHTADQHPNRIQMRHLRGFASKYDSCQLTASFHFPGFAAAEAAGGPPPLRGLTGAFSWSFEASTT